MYFTFNRPVKWCKIIGGLLWPLKPAQQGSVMGRRQIVLSLCYSHVVCANNLVETLRSDNDYDYDYEIRTWEAGTRL